MANISHGGATEAILSSSQQNIGEDVFSVPVNLVSYSVIVVATTIGSQEEGEVMALQETAGHLLKDFLLKLLRTL
jgi:F420-0:gamma-glutamyl ligase